MTSGFQTLGMFAAVQFQGWLFLVPSSSAGFYWTLVYLHSSYIITSTHGEHNMIHHILFIILGLFMRIRVPHLFSVPTAFSCHSWYMCVIETNDVIIAYNTLSGYFTFWTSAEPSTSCVHIRGIVARFQCIRTRTSYRSLSISVLWCASHYQTSMWPMFCFWLNCQCGSPHRVAVKEV